MGDEERDERFPETLQGDLQPVLAEQVLDHAEDQQEFRVLFQLRDLRVDLPESVGLVGHKAEARGFRVVVGDEFGGRDEPLQDQQPERDGARGREEVFAGDAGAQSARGLLGHHWAERPLAGRGGFPFLPEQLQVSRVCFEGKEDTGD